MNKNNSLDLKKRRTLKLITGITTTSLLTGIPSLATAQFISPVSDGKVIECKLISRADLSRAYLLMHNKTDHELATARFDHQSILFDNTILDMAEAYVEPVLIPPHDRVMVRLNLESGLQKGRTASTVINMNSNTQYLPQGTRVVDLPVRLENGLATISRHPITT